MSFSPDDTSNKRLGKNKNTSISKPQGNKEIGSDNSQCEIHTTPDLPCDCLDIIYKCLTTKKDRDSFGLTCHQCLGIQNNNRESLCLNSIKYTPDGNFSKLLCKLLFRFPHLKELHVIFGEKVISLPEITNSVTLQSEVSGSKIKHLGLDLWYKNTDMEVSLMLFSWFPLLTSIKLIHFDITDEGLKALAKSCMLLEKVSLVCGRLITDKSISFLLQNCRHLGTLILYGCDNITGIGFLGCPETLTHLTAEYCDRLTPEGISAIVSGGGLEFLRLCRGVPKFKTETIMTISKGCPLLKKLNISDCEEVELEGWQVIGLNCKNLERVDVYECRKLRDMGPKALCNGSNKLSRYEVDYCDNCTFKL